MRYCVSSDVQWVWQRRKSAVCVCNQTPREGEIMISLLSPFCLRLPPSLLFKMSSSPPAKVRRPNFTCGEVLCIIHEVKKRLPIISGKLDFKSGITHQRKDEAWQEITDAVNIIFSVPRTMHEVRLKYKDMRTQCKSKYAKHVRHMGGTGKSR